MKFLPHCEASCKTETKQPFEEQKENPSRLQRYVDEALAFHPLAILYPIIRVSQEEKKCEKIKTESDFACCQRACPTCHVHGALYSTTPGGDPWSRSAGAGASV